MNIRLRLRLHLRFVLLLLCFLTVLWLTPDHASAQKVCAGTLPQRLVVGGQGQLTNTGPGQKIVPVRVRDNPGTKSKVIAQLEEGLIFQVLSGPECKDGYAWWQISSQGILGWIAEGDATDYFVEPVQETGTIAPTGSATPILIDITPTPVPTQTPIPLPAAGVFAAFKTGPVNTTGAIPAYQVAPDFGNVVMAEALSPNQLDYLQRNNFVVSPGTSREFYDVYQQTHKSYQPLFITADSLLHAFHLAFDKVLRTAEVQHFYARVRDLSTSALIEADKNYQLLKGTEWEKAARRTVAYLAVPTRLLNPGATVPDYASDLVTTEIANINNAGGPGPSAIFPDLRFGEDWSQYSPRGHYTLSDLLSAYFRAMMYYGRMTFHLSNPEETKSALLLVAALRSANATGTPGLTAWSDIYEPTSFFVGQSDSLTVPQYSALIDHIYGAKANLKAIVGTALDPFVAAALALPAPKILTTVLLQGQDQDTESKGLRFMGQRFVWDAYAFNQLIYDKVGTIKKPRTLPSALDVLAAMGSDRAFQILDKEGATAFDHYSDQMNQLRRLMGTLRESDWTGTLYGAWLYTANALNQPVPGGYPGFMVNQPYTDRSLYASLGSYAELKHDTILYSEQSFGYTAGGGLPKGLPPEPVSPPNYVEPVPLVWARLAALAEMARDGLGKRNLLSEGDSAMLDDIAKLARRLQADSIVELANRPLSADEQVALGAYGDDLERILLASADQVDARSGLSRSKSPPTVALVADIATDPIKGRVLEIGVGNVFDIYAIVPVSGKLYLAHGGAYSYYEFASGDRLTDESWQELLASKKPPALPDWTFSFISKDAADPALGTAIQDFHYKLTLSLWLDPVYSYEQVRESTEKVDRYVASQLEPLAKARQYEGRQLVEMNIRSVDLQTVKNVPTAVITTREIWRAELHNSGPETDAEGPKIGERGPYTLDVTYTLTRDLDGNWTLADIKVNGSVPGWTQTIS